MKILIILGIALLIIAAIVVVVEVIGSFLEILIPIVIGLVIIVAIFFIVKFIKDKIEFNNYCKYHTNDDEDDDEDDSNTLQNYIGNYENDSYDDDTTPFSKDYTYTTKPLLTNTEIDFENNLRSAVEDIYYLQSQVSLNSIIHKENNGKHVTTSELNRLIDFVIFDIDTFHPVMAIELNDKTHLRQSRIDRDKKVQYICECAELPILTFWTYDPYSKIKCNNTQNYIAECIDKKLFDED